VTGSFTFHLFLAHFEGEVPLGTPEEEQSQKQLLLGWAVGKMMQREKAVWASSCARGRGGCGVAAMSRHHHPRGHFVPPQCCPLAGRQQAATTGRNTGFPVCRKQVCFLLSFWLYSQLNSNQHFLKLGERQGLLCFRPGNPWG